MRTLTRLADEFGEPEGEWVRLTHYFRQDELAQMIGARREVVSTLLNQLREQGVVAYVRKDALLLQPSGLQRMLTGTGKPVAEVAEAGP